MTIPVHIGLDIGGTASRWVACDATGAVIARGKASGATGHIFNPAEKLRLSTALQAVSEALAAEGLRSVSLIGGITGFGAAAGKDARALMGTLLSLAPGEITLMDDIVLAYVANFAPGQGHLISAGTGSIGVHVSAAGEVIRVGGRGILIDDAGSGSWIALQALDLMYRAHDHDGSFAKVETLAQQMFAEIGGSSWSDVRQFVYAGDRGRIGTLAVAVARAAEAGDRMAVDILRRAGLELAALAQALVGRGGTAPVRLIGGVLRLHPLILDAIRERLPGLDVALDDTDAALGAARLGAIGDTAWTALLARGLFIA